MSLYRITMWNDEGEILALDYVEAPAFNRFGQIPAALEAYVEIIKADVSRHRKIAGGEVAFYRPARMGFRTNNGHAVSTVLYEWGR